MKLSNLFRPAAYIQKYKKIKDEHARYVSINKYNNDLPALIKEQEDIFLSLGLDYKKAKDNAEYIIKNEQGFTLHKELYSEHWTIFAALDQSKIHRILEIGTFNGEFAKYLSILFPAAEIVTVDLCDDDPLFINSYKRQDEIFREKFIEHRTRMLSARNIKFIQTNSFFLPSMNLGKFDCVWVDACHEYPEVAWDTYTAWHLCNDEGWIFCDDIYLSDTPPKGNTNDSRDALLALKKCHICDVNFIIKRFSPEFSADPNKRKHIGILRK